MLLFAWFTVFPKDEGDAAMPVLRHAWQSLGLFTAEQIDQFVERICPRLAPEVRWINNEQSGWALPEWCRIQSLRPPWCFPFAEYNRMIEAVRSGEGE